MGYFFWLAAMVLSYALSDRHDSTYHGLCNTSRGALVGRRNSPMIDSTTHRTMSERSYHGATYRSTNSQCYMYNTYNAYNIQLYVVNKWIKGIRTQFRNLQMLFSNLTFLIETMWPFLHVYQSGAGIIVNTYLFKMSLIGRKLVNKQRQTQKLK